MCHGERGKLQDSIKVLRSPTAANLATLCVRRELLTKKSRASWEIFSIEGRREFVGSVERLFGRGSHEVSEREKEKEK